MNQKISIIGAGNMGGTFYKGLLKLFPEENLFICDKSQSKLDALGAKNASIDPNETLKEANVVILSIKPQSLDELMTSLKVSLNFKLIISIMAGISLDRLKEKTGSNRIVRAMPNLPVQVSKGVIGWVALPDVSDSDAKLIEKIFSALGDTIELKHESMIDAVTVLSGCGPAYFFLLTEFLANKAKSLGFSDEEARLISEKTLIGSTELLKKGDKTADAWKNAVTSPGGVTEAVLKHLNENDFEKIFDEALDSGLKRNLELNQS